MNSDLVKKLSVILLPLLALGAVGYLAASLIYYAFIALALGTVVLGIKNRDQVQKLFLAQVSKYREAQEKKLLKTDPIKAIDNSIRRMRERMQEVEGNRDSLNAQFKSLTEKIQVNELKANTSRRKATYANSIGDQQARGDFALEAKEFEDSNIELMKTREKVDVMLRIANSVCTSVGTTLRKTISSVSIKKEEYKCIAAANKAMTAGREILDEGKERETLNEALSELSTTTHTQLAQIESMIEKSQTVLRDIEFEREVSRDEAIKELERFESGRNLDHDQMGHAHLPVKR